ncbi:P-loop containing nucleoside triphosphate hydrolase protein [Halenospora varia]|nr:P-loop containing nucleoside triphosphate hydrolase protein [Halenospora varia]
MDKTNAIYRLVYKKLEQYPAPSKIIIYSRTIKQTKELSWALGCYKYYYRVGDQDKKEKIMGHWQYGDRRLIMATNAFGLGINAPNVQVVIYVGAIYQMQSYSQESGYSGQDRQQSKAIVMMPARKQDIFQKKQAQAHTRT